MLQLTLQFLCRNSCVLLQGDSNYKIATSSRPSDNAFGLSQISSADDFALDRTVKITGMKFQGKFSLALAPKAGHPSQGQAYACLHKTCWTCGWIGHTVLHHLCFLLSVSAESDMPDMLVIVKSSTYIVLFVFSELPSFQPLENSRPFANLKIAMLRTGLVSNFIAGGLPAEAATAAITNRVKQVSRCSHSALAVASSMLPADFQLN